MNNVSWQRPRKAAAPTVTSAPEQNSELADFPGRGVGVSRAAFMVDTPFAVSVLRSISLRSDLRPRDSRERIVPTGTSRIVATSLYDGRITFSRIAPDAVYILVVCDREEPSVEIAPALPAMLLCNR